MQNRGMCHEVGWGSGHSVGQKQLHAWRDIMQGKINSLHIQKYV